MPEGIGKAYEEWNIERIESVRQLERIECSKIDSFRVLFGWAGAHHISEEISWFLYASTNN